MKIQLNFKVRLECVKKFRVCQECEEDSWECVEEDRLQSNTLKQLSQGWGGNWVFLKNVGHREDKHKLQNHLNVKVLISPWVVCIQN